MEVISKNGFRIKIWEAKCWCGFVTGLALVTYPDGITKRLFSGAGCEEKPRRDKKQVLKLALEITGDHLAPHMWRDLPLRCRPPHEIKGCQPEENTNNDSLHR